MNLDVDKLCDDFSEASKNQSAFDLFYYDFHDVSAVDYGFLPRPSLWLNKNCLVLAVLRQSKVLIRFVWRYLAYIYFFLKLVVFLFRRGGWLGVECACSTVMLATCKRSIDVAMQSQSILNDNVVFMAVPGFRDSKSSRQVDAVSVLSGGELIKCFFIACNIHFNQVRRSGERLFQSYTALDWVVTFCALSKIRPRRIIIADHHDRWAVLVDAYCGERNNSEGRIELVLVQHGLEFGNTYERMMDLGLSGGLPYKLKNLSVIYTYNEIQLEVFCRYIISSQFDGVPLTSRFYTYSLPISEIDIEGCSILIVGYARCERFHVELYSKLSRLAKFECFYKPHPTLKPSPLVVGAGWVVIDDKDFFPKVDLVVSYPSTLVGEYRCAGITVIEHDFDAGSDNVEALVDSILPMLDGSR